MARPNSETVTTFGEVLHSANNAHSRGSRAANIDNRLMIYFQGMKVYVPDGFQADTLVQGWHIPAIGIIRMCMVISVLKHLPPIM